MFALDFLGVLLAHLMLLSIEMPLVGPVVRKIIKVFSSPQIL